MNTIRLSLLIIFISTIGCSNSVSDFEDKIEARVAENNGEMSSIEIKAAAVYLDSWSKKDFYQGDIDKFKEADKGTAPAKDLILFTGSSSIRFWSTLKDDMAPHNVLNRGFGGFKLRVSPFNTEGVPWRLRIFILNRGFGDLNYVPALLNDGQNTRILNLRIWGFKIPRPPAPVDQLRQSSEF